MTTMNEIEQIEQLKKQIAEIEARMKSKLVLVRTYSAGVHFGELVGRNGTEVVLKNARRIHYWEGAFTLSAVAVDGVPTEGPKHKATRISCGVDEILLTQAIEVIPLTQKAAKSLTQIS